MYIYIYIERERETYIVYLSIYIYIYTESEREGERDIAIFAYGLQGLECRGFSDVTARSSWLEGKDIPSLPG